jgi:hypothetical protein
MAKLRQGPFELFSANNLTGRVVSTRTTSPNPEPRSLLVLGHERLTAKRKENEIVIRTVKADVAIVALDATGIAPSLQCFKSEDLDGANPAGKRVAFDTFGIVSPAHLLQQLSPRVVAQLRLAEKIGV